MLQISQAQYAAFSTVLSQSKWQLTGLPVDVIITETNTQVVIDTWPGCAIGESDPLFTGEQYQLGLNEAAMMPFPALGKCVKDAHWKEYEVLVSYQVEVAQCAICLMPQGEHAAEVVLQAMSVDENSTLTVCKCD
jgi:hypothetical protein